MKGLYQGGQQAQIEVMLELYSCMLRVLFKRQFVMSWATYSWTKYWRKVCHSSMKTCIVIQIASICSKQFYTLSHQFLESKGHVQRLCNAILLQGFTKCWSRHSVVVDQPRRHSLHVETCGMCTLLQRL